MIKSREKHEEGKRRSSKHRLRIQQRENGVMHGVMYVGQSMNTGVDQHCSCAVFSVSVHHAH